MGTFQVKDLSLSLSLQFNNVNIMVRRGEVLCVCRGGGGVNNVLIIN